MKIKKYMQTDINNSAQVQMFKNKEKEIHILISTKNIPQKTSLANIG